MTDIQFRSDFTVKLINSMGSDEQIANVARVSTGTSSVDSKKNYGLLNMLMRDRHATPFESTVIQFYIESPVFLNREFFRHRLASYNETSSRYREMEPTFYLPPVGRPLRQVGKPGAYTFEEGTYLQAKKVEGAHKRAATESWAAYTGLLDSGVAREVARNVLPLTLYSSFYVTMNLRSLFNFFSLRRVTEDTSVPSFPLYEISQVSAQMEALTSTVVPVSMGLFNLHGRKAI